VYSEKEAGLEKYKQHQLFMIIPIPENWQYRYKILHAIMYAVIVLIVGIFLTHALFPTLVFSFNFKTPNSSKNNILDPRSPENTPRTNGKLETGGSLLGNVGVAGDFSQANIEVTLEKKSAVPNNLKMSLRRSYRSFMLPTGTPITDFPEAELYKIDGVYYALKDSVFYPFVSDGAYLTRYPGDFAKDEPREFLARYPVSENWIGFRVGSLVSFADGVFLIISETEMRPVGSAEIFLALGYHFENVIQTSEEEIGIYKRGKIFNLGEQHPDGTLLLDQDTQKYYLVEQNMKRPLTDSRYLNFLLKQQIPINVSAKSNKTNVNCNLEPSLFGQSFSCVANLTELKQSLGNDFEIRLDQSDTDIDINTLQVSLTTDRSQQNMLTLLSQIKTRLIARFGFGNE
jgi:hypothetical protein